MENIVIGVDMGATHIRICLMNLQGNILLTERRKTQNVIAKGLVQGLTDFCQQFAKTDKVSQIVIGLPAAISKDRRQVLSVPNIAFSQAEFNQISPALSAHFHCPVKLERDVNLQLVYDVYHHDIKDKLVLGAYLGTGMGFAIWLNGELFIGSHGVAGELGHIPYGDEKIQCNCGNQGCLETVCSGIALKRWYDSQPFDFPMDLLFQQKANDDFVQHYLNHAAKAVSAAVNLFDADALILGGGVMDMQDFPLPKLKQLIAQYVRKPLPYQELSIIKAESSSFNGAIGAALFALTQQEKK